MSGIELFQFLNKSRVETIGRIGGTTENCLISKVRHELKLSFISSESSLPLVDIDWNEIE